MPIHDWSRVDAGVFHAFHTSWIGDIQKALNAGLLPTDYYALAEQVGGGVIPDVLTLKRNGRHGQPHAGETPPGNGVTVMRPPATRIVATVAEDAYVRKRRTIAIRQVSDDRVIALLEIVSPGNKSSAKALRDFVAKALAALEAGVHLLLIDLHGPTARDPQGVHGVIWEELGGRHYTAPAGKPLTLVSYVADLMRTAYVEPVAVGDKLRDMPLFLEPDFYVNVPLEATYQQAWQGVPRHLRGVLEAPESKKHRAKRGRKR